MRRIHLLLASDDTDAQALHPLVEAVGADGGRVGALSWYPTRASDDGELAAAAGLLRFVHVDAAGSTARKPRSGPAVLRDVVREHFRGCRVVLIRGEATGELASLPRLSATAGGFRLDAGGSERQLTAAELAAWLRRPPR